MDGLIASFADVFNPDHAVTNFAALFQVILIDLALAGDNAIVIALAARNLSPDPFVGYLEAFRYGMPPHGGFAIGLERLLMQLTGAANLRETTLFPRDLTRLTP